MRFESYPRCKSNKEGFVPHANPPLELSNPLILEQITSAKDMATDPGVTDLFSLKERIFQDLFPVVTDLLID